MPSIQLSIAEPCHEDWNAMLPEEKGRFCLSCQQTVVDFTNMSDGQVFDYFKKYKGTTCGQFSPQQLDRNIAKPATHSIGRWKYFWQILLPAVFAFYKGEAQMLKGKVAPKTVCKADTARPEAIAMGMVTLPSSHSIEPKYELQGAILSDKQVPVPYATIVSESGKHAVADSTGHFKIELQPGKSLTISSIGYEAKTISFDSIKSAVKHVDITKSTNTILIEANIQMKPATVDTQNAVVIGSGLLMGRLGGISVVKSWSISKFKPVQLATDFPAIKIFPNPINKGQSFQISLQLKKTGNYLLQIMDAAGKMMLEEKLAITGSNYTETINGNALQQAGVYFIKVSSPTSKKDKGLTGKIVVQ